MNKIKIEILRLCCMLLFRRLFLLTFCRDIEIILNVHIDILTQEKQFEAATR